MAFIDQVQGGNTKIIPVVYFNNTNDISNITSTVALSTEDHSERESLFQNTTLYPFLNSFPSVKESLNIETKKYSISSVTLSIHNADIMDGKFSDLLDTEHFRINRDVIIRYFPNNKASTSYIAYNGRIKYTSHDQGSVKIELEDATQDSLYKDVPIKHTEDDESLLEKSRNIPYPMVYGQVPKSPCIFSSYADTNDNYTLNPSIYIDSPNSTMNYIGYSNSENINNGGDKINVVPIFVGVDGTYVQLARFAETVNQDYEEGSDFDNFNIVDNTEPLIRLNRISDSSEYTNDISNSVLRAYLLRKPSSIQLVSHVNEEVTTNAPSIVFNSSFSLVSGSSDPNTNGLDVINYNNEWLNGHTPTSIASNVANGTQRIWLTNPSDVAYNQLANSRRSFQRITTTNNSVYNRLRNEAYRIVAQYPTSAINFPCDTYFLAKIYIEPNSNTSSLHLDITDPDYSDLDEVANHIRVSGYINLSMSGTCPPMISDNNDAGFWEAGEYGGGYGDDIDNSFVDYATPYNFLQDGTWDVSFLEGIVEWIYPLDLMQNYFLSNTDEPNNPFTENKATFSGAIGGNDTEEFDNHNTPYSFNTLTEAGNIESHTNCKSDTWTSTNQYDNITISLNDQIRKSMLDNEEVPFGFFAWNKFYASGLKIFQNIFIPQFWEQTYYADVKGRNSEYISDYSESPAQQIINDIVGTELNHPEAVQSTFSDLEYDLFEDSSYLEYAFTQTETINSKLLIEELASFSVLFPIFKDNKLSYKTIKTKYDPSSVDIKSINSSEVQKYSFKRTDTRSLYSKLKFNYNYDFSLGTYKSSTELDIGNIVGGYDKEYYHTAGLDKSMDCRFIYNDATAFKIAKYLLLNNCNPHNIITVDMPLSYITYELGDIVKFNSLINRTKIYGEDYSQGIYNHNGQDKYGLFMVQSIKKGQKGVTLELYQLHNLVGDTTQIIEYCPLHNYEEYDEELQMGFDGGIWYQPNEELCINEIEEEQYIEPVYGCDNQYALNFNQSANTNDGSCFFYSQDHWIGGFTSAGAFIEYFSGGFLDSPPPYGNISHINYVINPSIANTETIPFFPSDVVDITLNIDTHQSWVNMGLLLPKCIYNNTFEPFDPSPWDEIVLYIKHSHTGQIYKRSYSYDYFKTISNNLTADGLDFSNGTVDMIAIEGDVADESQSLVVFFISQTSNATHKWWGLNISLPIIEGNDSEEVDYLHYRSGYVIPAFGEDGEITDIGYTYNFFYDQIYNSPLVDQMDTPAFNLFRLVSESIASIMFAMSPPISHPDAIGRTFFADSYQELIGMDDGIVSDAVHVDWVTAIRPLNYDYAIPTAKLLNVIQFVYTFTHGMLQNPYAEYPVSGQELVDLIFDGTYSGLGDVFTSLNISPIYQYMNPLADYPYDLVRENTFYTLVGTTKAGFANRFSTNPNDLNYTEIILKESDRFSPIFGGSAIVDEAIIDEYMDSYQILRTSNEWKQYISDLGSWNLEIRVARYSGGAILPESLDSYNGSIMGGEEGTGAIEYVPFKINHEDTNYNYSQTSLFDNESLVQFIDFRDLSPLWTGDNSGKRIRVEFYNNSDSTDDYYYIEVRRKAPRYTANIGTRYLVQQLCNIDPNPIPAKRVIVFNGAYIYTYNYVHTLNPLGVIDEFSLNPLFSPMQSAINPDTGQEVMVGDMEGWDLAHHLTQTHFLEIKSHFQNIDEDLEGAIGIIANEPSDCRAGYITSGEGDFTPAEEVEITNYMGIYCINNKTIESPTGGEPDQPYHNEFYAIGNPDNELIYNKDTEDLDDIETGEDWVELANTNSDQTINNLIALGYSKEMKFTLTEDSDTDNEGGGGG